MPDPLNPKDRALTAALTPPSTGAFLAGVGVGLPADLRSTRFVTGSVFAGRYRMIAPLGASGPGEVWRADDLVLQTPVALKLLPDAAAAGRTRILDEVRLARQITHPAVCRVFDVGESGGSVFYSMELVQGEDLATLLRRAGRLPFEKVVELGGQLCDALAAAHAHGVVHGNLKPADILVDEDGFVRVTDFGITVEGSGKPRERVYRGPEQLAHGAPASERTDLYAAGAILYELLVGQPPVSGEDGARPARPARPSQLVPEVPRRLERVVLDALALDPAHRPASATVMAERLRGVLEPAQRASGVLWIPAAVVVLAALAIGAGWLMSGRTAPALSNRDTMVIADFTNTTGETVFDGALKVALAVALEQSPYLKVFPDERVRETLRLMQRSPDERITRELAREIALREQSKALVAGSVARLGSHYVLTLEAVNAQSGDAMAREQVEVPGREEVLGALGTAASRLRSRLGESLASVQQFDAPLARATTPSLDALHAYSLALDDGRVNLRVEAIPHLLRALELDPQFALAQAMLSGIYANTGRSAEAPLFARRAFELRDRVSERERFFISWRYYIDSAQAWDQALALATSWTRTYPREPFAFNSLGMATGSFGRHEAAIDAFRTAIALDPRFVPPHGNLVGSLLATGQYGEAARVIRDTRTQGIDGLSLYRGTYVLALVAKDEAAIASALAAARGSTVAAMASLNWEAHTRSFEGRLQDAHAVFARAIREAEGANLKEQSAQWQAEDAESHALAGQCALARPEALSAARMSPDNFTLERAARTLAFCGADADAAAIRGDLLRRFPEATLTKQIQIPIIDALLSLGTEPARARDRLEPVRPSDGAPAAEFWPSYVRGLAYLRLRDGERAAAEFERILQHRGEAPMSMLYPLATLGSARAAARSGNPARARAAYQEFFALWRDADPGLASLAEARREYAALR